MRISTNILDLSWTSIEFIDLECRARFASFLMFDSHATPHICSGLCVKITVLTIKEEAWVITTQAQGNQFNSIKVWIGSNFSSGQFNHSILNIKVKASKEMEIERSS